MTCPDCAEKIGMKALMSATGISGVVCPRCNSSLEPKRLTMALAIALPMGASFVVRVLLQPLHLGMALDLFAVIATSALVFLIAASRLIRLEKKPFTVTSLKQ